MSLEHEYALVGGYNRTHVGRWLARLAAGISAALVLVVLELVNVAKALTINVNIPPAMMSISIPGNRSTTLTPPEMRCWLVIAMSACV